MDDEHAAALVRPSRGVHLVLDREFLPGDVALMVPRTDDGRVLFAIPWHDRAIVGTTDTAVDSTPIEPRASREEVAFLLDHAGRYLTRAPRAEDVLSVFSGLRPLLSRGARGPTAKLSREHEVLVSRSGLVTVTGGKWTTYRRMARDGVDRAAEVAGLAPSPCLTETLRLHGAAEGCEPSSATAYGSDSGDVGRLIASHPGWDAPLHPAFPYRAGEVVWAARMEMARQVEDVLARRLRALFLDAKASIEAAPRVAELLADELGCDEAWRASQVGRFRALAGNYLPS
jgi:glycerol-3-phosphate dehydrogenase